MKTTPDKDLNVGQLIGRLRDLQSEIDGIWAGVDTDLSPSNMIEKASDQAKIFEDRIVEVEKELVSRVGPLVDPDAVERWEERQAAYALMYPEEHHR